MRRFNASNKPRTCLWCGRTLLCQSPESRLERRILERMKLYNCDRAKAEAEELPRHQYWKDRYGKHNGLFDTDSCAINFGIAAAKSGFRLQPKGKI